MDAEFAIRRTGSIARVGASVAGAAVVAILLATLFVATRRATGAFALPISMWGALACGAALGLASAFTQISLVRWFAIRRGLDAAILAAATAFSIAIGLLVVVPSGSAMAIVAFFAPLAAGMFVAGRGHCAQRAKGRGAARLTEARERVAKAACGESLDAVTNQQWIRRREGALEILEGMAAAVFPPHAKVTAIHVAICPPFRGTPVAVAEVLDDAAAVVRVAEVNSFGVRLDVRRQPASAEAERVVVGIVVRECLESEST